MTTVLIVDPNKDTRLALEARLSESNQFDRVLSCANLNGVQAMLSQHEVKVLLLDAEQLGDAALLHSLKDNNSELGVVLVRGHTGTIDSATLQELGAHAQTSRLAAPMEIVASVAKALVARLKPVKRMLRKRQSGA